MNQNHEISTLIELVEKFIYIANTLLKKGLIDQEVYNKITEHKIKFLENYKLT